MKPDDCPLTMTASVQTCLCVSLLVSALLLDQSQAAPRLHQPPSDEPTSGETTAKSRNRRANIDPVNYKRFLLLATQNRGSQHYGYGFVDLASPVSWKKRRLFDRLKRIRVLSVQLPFRTTVQRVRERDARKKELIRTLSTMAHFANIG
ncbi:hypothetical protein NP493_1348g00029 [Ridgeia piscesae]|uniref:Secreted protein n=1 Tax=Ridgeia piscesae TaxID=27915 RepID=A0AAD9NEP5_RIDPI|nr:hypothetical protein NP493_1348g00029 [Ridgeia piscesae]